MFRAVPPEVRLQLASGGADVLQRELLRDGAHQRLRVLSALPLRRLPRGCHGCCHHGRRLFVPPLQPRDRLFVPSLLHCCRCRALMRARGTARRECRTGSSGFFFMKDIFSSGTIYGRHFSRDQVVFETFFGV